MIRTRTKLAFIICLGLGASAGAIDKAPTPSLTSWGHPNLQGTWSYRSATPLQRPESLGDRSAFSSEEATSFEQATDQRNETFLRSGAIGEFVGDEPWADRGRELTEGQRASLIVDPPNGRLPARTELGRERASAFLSQYRESPGGPEDRTVSERCLIWPLAPLQSQNYNNNVRIVQTPDHVVIETEMIHQVRVVPLGAAPRPGAASPDVDARMRQFLGVSTGYWDGDTLIVETTGFRDYMNPLGTTPDMRLVERFSLDSEGRVVYEYTVNDPAVFESAWTARQTLTRLDGRMYEYACHEGNQSMGLMLRSARATER